MKYFTLKELTASSAAAVNGLKNEPSENARIALIALTEKCLDPAREIYGKPIKVTSGFRSKAVNAVVGGSKTSQHVKGEAVDLQCCKGGSNSAIFDVLRRQANFDQLIWEYGTADEPDWVHVSFSLKGNRGEVLQALKVGKQTVYKHF